MRDEDERRTQQPVHAVGQPLDALSLADLDARIALLREEIARIEAARAAKQTAQSAADAFFKRG